MLPQDGRTGQGQRARALPVVDNGLGAGSNGVFRLSEFEAALDANFSPAALNGLSVPASGLNSDLHADADYRAHLIGVMARRAVAAA